MALYIASVSAEAKTIHTSSSHSRNRRNWRRCTTSETSVAVKEMAVGLRRNMMLTAVHEAGPSMTPESSVEGGGGEEET